MSNERRYECLPQEQTATADTTNCSQKRASLPTCAHVATSKMKVQSQPLDQVFAAGKTLGLDHRDQIERLSSKILHETWHVSGVDIDGVHPFQLWPPGQRRPADPLGL